MKKRYIALLLAIYAVTLYFIVLTGVNNLADRLRSTDEEGADNKYTANGIYSNQLINNYDIYVDFDPIKKMYNSKQTIIYVNNTDTTLNEIYLHIYPNAFKSEATTPYIIDDYGTPYVHGFSKGDFQIYKLLVNEENTAYNIDKNNVTILHIKLKQPIKPKENIKIYMEYGGVLPRAQQRFGYGKDTYNFGNWYPIVAVYDDTGWNLDPYYKLGDPFYSDIGNYHVTIAAPKDMIIAASGNIISEKIENNKKIWKIEAMLMRDFAWTASKEFIKLEKEIDGILVKGYFIRNDQKVNTDALKAACDAIKVFNRVFGKYPYEQYSVIASNHIGGMEYPGLVFVNEKFYNNQLLERLKKVIVHETAHQWWYSAVGNNEVDEPWLDEGLTTYSEYIFFKEAYGKKYGENYFKKYIYNSYNMRKNQLNDEVIAKSLDKFKNNSEYHAVAYKKAAMFFYEIEKKYGERKMYNILRNYYMNYKFKNANTYQFLKICEEVTNDNFDHLANKWLYQK
ncbi:M1 family metallopeptidase [Crassaminicella indica]|uniref:M1 family metallopeptidase n=1 Tax=Crassaminicella indica TaxID=2855394 RepID=A0ABX8RF64_9CLOT|nr:M1 family metallopeptidase [Crassaminicella indica]QXM05586.1 M1 family metallopeptidase [Crassaminicella indica]